MSKPQKRMAAAWCAGSILNVIRGSAGTGKAPVNADGIMRALGSCHRCGSTPPLERSWLQTRVLQPVVSCDGHRHCHVPGVVTVAVYAVHEDVWKPDGRALP